MYAVREGELDQGRRVKRDRIVISDSDTDDDIACPARKKKPAVTKVFSELRNITRIMQEVHKDVHDVFTINEQMRIPAGLHRLLRETFRCTICCAAPITPPVIFARRCKNIVGCESCVDSWYRAPEGMLRTCPTCRAERAYAETTRIRGLDDFLVAIKPILNRPEAGHADTRDSDVEPVASTSTSAEA